MSKASDFFFGKFFKTALVFLFSAKNKVSRQNVQQKAWLGVFKDFLAGGFKYLLFSPPLPGEDSHLNEYLFNGWFNHQLVLGRSYGVWNQQKNGGIMDDLLFGGVRLHYQTGVRWNIQKKCSS